MSGDDGLYIKTEDVHDAADDMQQIVAALTALSELAKTALVNLAEYDSPQYSEEIKGDLHRWISIVGDPDNPNQGPTMIKRMADFSSFLHGVADSYTA
jgi:hypothetical protein